MLTEIVDGSKFYAHVAGDTAHVTALQQQVATVCKAAAPGGFEPKVGGFCCALFSEDEQDQRFAAHFGAISAHCSLGLEVGDT